MQKFYLVIATEKIYLFDYDNRTERQYIEGNPYLKFHLNTVKEDINKLLAYLISEYNMALDSPEIEFVVIKNFDELCSQLVIKELGTFVANVVELESIMKNLIAKLRTDKNLLIDEFGVNFDGINYKLNGKVIVKNEFSLLGYTVNEEKILVDVK